MGATSERVSVFDPARRPIGYEYRWHHPYKHYGIGPWNVTMTLTMAEIEQLRACDEMEYRWKTTVT